MSTTPADLVAKARAQIIEIPPQQVCALSADAVIIDVREPAEFTSGRINGAINIPRGVLEFEIEAHPALASQRMPPIAPREREILLYCRTGGRSALAAVALQALGFVRVRSLQGGLNAYLASGLPITAAIA